MATQKPYYIACVACLGAPEEIVKQCKYCKGTGESSRAKNKIAVKDEIDAFNGGGIDTEALIYAVKCMGFNPVRLARLFSDNPVIDEAMVALMSIDIRQEALEEYCATGVTEDGLYLCPDKAKMKKAESILGWAKMDYSFLSCGTDAEFDQRFAKWRE